MKFVGLDSSQRSESGCAGSTFVVAAGADVGLLRIVVFFLGWDDQWPFLTKEPHAQYRNIELAKIMMMMMLMMSGSLKVVASVVKS